MYNMIVERYVPDIVVSEIENLVRSLLNRCGIYYRVFCRRKSSESIIEKIHSHGYPDKDGKIMQDLIGIRVALYFSDDVEVCKQIIEKAFEIDNISATKVNEKTFSPERLNLVCKIPQEHLCEIDSTIWKSYPIDQTFEIQIRTVFSEGWHEVEHDVRYKSDTDWDSYKELSRSLNGIFATLETCDWAILQLLDELAYQEYKNKHWTSMLKNKLRIKLTDSKLDDNIIKIFDDHPEIAKSFFKVDRTALLHFLAYESNRVIPLNLNNIVYIINTKWVHDPIIDSQISVRFKRLISY